MLTKGKNNFAGKVDQKVDRNRCTHTTVRTVRIEETRYNRKVSGFGLDRTSINNDDNNVRSLCHLIPLKLESESLCQNLLLFWGFFCQNRSYAAPWILRRYHH